MIVHGSARIILLSWGFDPEHQGGIARFGLQLAEHLHRLGVQVELWGVLQLNTEREHNERQRLEAIGVPTRSFPQKKTELHTVIAITSALVQYIQQHPQTILSVHGALADLCGVIVKRMTHTSVVRTVHSEREWYKRPQLGWLVDKASAMWLDGEIGVSSRITSMINQRRSKRHQATWIPPLTDFNIVAHYESITSSQARHLFNLPDNQYILGSVGRFTPQKGYDILLKAVAKLDIPHIHVALLGEGPMDEELINLVQQRNITTKVSFITPNNQVGQFLRCLDLYVSSSRWEGLSLSVVEAAWCGLPIVATNVSGTTDIQQLLNMAIMTCMPDDISLLADTIKQAITAPQQTKATTKHPEAFAASTVAQQYLAYFSTL